MVLARKFTYNLLYAANKKIKKEVARGIRSAR